MTERGHPAEDRDWRHIARLVGAVLIVVLLLTFMAVNTRKVEVDFVVSEVRAPLFVILFITATAGALLGLFVHRLRRR